VRAVPHLCELYPEICLTTEEKARKTLNQGSRRVPVGTMNTEYTERNIHDDKNTYSNVQTIRVHEKSELWNQSSDKM